MRPFPCGTRHRPAADRPVRARHRPGPRRTPHTPPDQRTVPAGPAAPTPAGTHLPPGRRRAGDRGASSIEFAGMLPLLLLVALAAIQLGLAGYAVQQAGTGARAAARTASDEELADQCAGSGKGAMSDWTANRASFDCARDEDEATATATVTIPSVIPGIDGFGDASRTVTMPSE